MKRILRADSLTTFDVSPDGSTVSVNVLDRAGVPGSLELPTVCLNQLLMTLPRMIEQAMHRNCADRSLRLVHPMECFTLEFGEVDASGAQRFILTLQTGGGFKVSFALTGGQLGAIHRAIYHEVTAPPTPSLNS